MNEKDFVDTIGKLTDDSDAGAKEAQFSAPEPGGISLPPQDIITLHEEVLYPTVRVTTPKAGGSGTIVYSKKDSKGQALTMVMTNHHVVEGCIEIKKAWDPKVSQERKKEFKKTVRVEFFKYNNFSRNIGSFSVEADIVAYDKEQDVALLQLRDKERLAEYIANVFPMSAIDEVHIFEPVFTVGAALGHPPLPTDGRICFMDDEIDNYKYWMMSAASIYGNSGGATFRWSPERNRYEYIGIPSRISVILSGFFGTDAITHMSYSIPITRITKFWEDNCYQFVYDSEYTPEQCNELREKMRKEAERKLEARLGVVTGEED